MKSKCFICVDAGGTKTKIVVFSLEGKIIYDAIFGPGSPAVAKKQAFVNIEKGLDEVIQKINPSYEVAFIQMGVSGLGTVQNVSELETKYFKKYQVLVSIVNDAIIALYSIIQNKYQSGILVLAGTGSAVYGIKDGKTLLIGGWGHLLNEQGSAYALVRNTTLNAIDHFEKGLSFTPFEQKFMQYLGLKDIYGFKPFFYQNQKEDIAKHAVYIKGEAIKGDPYAISILEESGRFLADQVINLVKGLKLDSDAILGLRGGFFTDGDIIIKAMLKRLKNEKIKFILELKDVPPVIGAYYLALKHYQEKQNV